MPIGILVFAQLMDFLPPHIFRRCVARYPSSCPAKKNIRASGSISVQACAISKFACMRRKQNSIVLAFAVTFRAAIWLTRTRSAAGAVSPATES